MGYISERVKDQYLFSFPVQSLKLKELCGNWISHFSFSHSDFERFVRQTRKNQGLFGKALTLFLTCLSYIAAVSAPIQACLEFLFTRSPRNILSVPLAAFSHSHHQNHIQHLEGNDPCCNDYNRSLERGRLSRASNQGSTVPKSSALPKELQKFSKMTF